MREQQAESHPNQRACIVGEGMPLAYRAVRNGVWVALGSYWAIGFGFVANIALIRLLTPAIYGEFALAMFFATLFDLYGKVSLNFAFAQQRKVNGETLGTLFVVSVLLGASTLLLSLLAAPVLQLTGYSPHIVFTTIALCTLIFVSSWVSVFGIELETSLHSKPISIAMVVATPLSYIPAFWLAYHGLGQYSLLSQTATYSLFTGIVTMLYTICKRRHVLSLSWRFNRRLATQYLRFGITSGAGNFLTSLLMNADNFLLGTIAGATALGYYDRAYRLAQWPGLLLNSIYGRAAVFTYAQLREAPQKLQRSFEMLLWVSSHVTAPIALALFLSAQDLVHLLFGPQWEPSVMPLRILLIAALLRPLWENAWAIFVGLGLPKQVIRLSVLQLVILLIAGTALSMAFSAIGTAVAVVLMFASGLVVAKRLLQNHLLTQHWNQVFFGPVVAIALTAASYPLLVRLIGNALPLWLAVAWKVIWAVVGFSFFALIIQPRQFTGRMVYVWRLLRAR